MKKTISVLLALVLILAMSTTAFAATIESSPGSQDIDVNAKYVDGVSAPTKYSVDVSWGAMEFTYTVSGTKTWDPETHTYTASTQPAWTASGNTITVTNHSNTDITDRDAAALLSQYLQKFHGFQNCFHDLHRSQTCLVQSLLQDPLFLRLLLRRILRKSIRF